MELQSPRHNPYSSVQHALDELEEKGYTERFTVLDENKLQDSKGSFYQSDDLVINEIHRFVDKDHDSEKSAVYALVAKNGKKGTIVDHYGEESNETINAFLMNVDRHDALHN